MLTAKLKYKTYRYNTFYTKCIESYFYIFIINTATVTVFPKASRCSEGYNNDQQVGFIIRDFGEQEREAATPLTRATLESTKTK